MIRRRVDSALITVRELDESRGEVNAGASSLKLDARTGELPQKLVAEHSPRHQGPRARASLGERTNANA